MLGQEVVVNLEPAAFLRIGTVRTIVGCQCVHLILDDITPVGDVLIVEGTIVHVDGISF